MSDISNKDRAELNYLNVRNEIADFVDKIGYQNISSDILNTKNNFILVEPTTLYNRTKRSSHKQP